MGQETWLVEKIQRCKIGGNEFSLVYVKDLANIIRIFWLWFSCGLGEQSLLPKMSKRRERRLNREHSICIPGKVRLILKRRKSCQFICSLLRRIRVVKQGRSTLCYHLILLLCSEHWFLMQFLYKQNIYFVWRKTSNLLSHTKLWGCSVPRHMGPWRLAGSVLASECRACGFALIWALGYMFSLGSHLRS